MEHEDDDYGFPPLIVATSDHRDELLTLLQDQQSRLEHLVRLQRRSMRLLWVMMAIQVAQVVMWVVKLVG